MPDLENYRVGIKGEWDIDDLFIFAEVFQETYAYFYFISEFSAAASEADQGIARAKAIFETAFWSGRTPGRWFAQRLYDLIPPPGLALRRIEYSSPGFIEFAGVLAVLLLLARVVKSWAEAGEKVLDLIERIEKFFAKSGFDRRRRSTEVTEETAQQLDEARELAFELAALMKIPREFIERLIEVTGNPISAVRVLVTLSREARRLITLQEHGKLDDLPVPDDQE